MLLIPPTIVYFVFILFYLLKSLTHSLTRSLAHSTHVTTPLTRSLYSCNRTHPSAGWPPACQVPGGGTGCQCIERCTGLDLDGDGEVGGRAARREQTVQTAKEKGFAYGRRVTSMLLEEAELSTAKCRHQQAKDPAPSGGANDENATAAAAAANCENSSGGAAGAEAESVDVNMEYPPSMGPQSDHQIGNQPLV